MPNDETKKRIIDIFTANERYADGARVEVIPKEYKPLPPMGTSWQMAFTFAKTATSHFLSLNKIIAELSKIGELDAFDYREPKGSPTNQQFPELHFSVRIGDDSYEIIFVLPK